MNIFDIIVYIALAWAVFNGWRRGLLMQLLSLVALFAGMYFALERGPEVGAMLGTEGLAAKVLGFAVIFFATLVVITVLGHLVKRVFRFAGLGIFDTLLGILFSVVKVGLVVSVAFICFESLNRDYKLASEQIVVESKWYKPVKGFVGVMTPYFEQVADQVDQVIKQ